MSACPKCRGEIRLVPGEDREYQCSYCEWYGEIEGTQTKKPPKRKPRGQTTGG